MSSFGAQHHEPVACMKRFVNRSRCSGVSSEVPSIAARLATWSTRLFLCSLTSRCSSELPPAVSMLSVAAEEVTEAGVRGLDKKEYSRIVSSGLRGPTSKKWSSGHLRMGTTKPCAPPKTPREDPEASEYQALS
eukprot:scaffold22139_cov146-Isochrysis_galbana.AAC.2